MAKLVDVCPVPDLRDYEFDETISAVIVSVYSAEKGLFYAIDKRKFDIFLGIESYTPRNRNEFKTVPAFHELFLYVNEEGKTFRAYRLLSNPAANGSIRFFLIDVGIRMYLNFTAKQFYAFPDEFDLNLIHPMALFCHLDDCSTGDLLKSEFLQLSLEKTVRLKVVREIKVQNDLGPGRFCLGVVTVNASELLNDGISLHESDENDSQDDYLDLTLVENEDSAVYVPVESHLISQAHDVPIPGSMVLVYEAHVETENTLWACIRTQDSISQEISTKAMDMHTSMNVDSYKKLKEPPRAGDMVIAFGADDRFHRGYVVNTINSKNIVFFVDFGYDLTLETNELYEFPMKLASLPFQAVNLIIADFEPNGTKADIMKELSLECKNTGKFAKVISVNSALENMELTVNIYNSNGNDIAELVCERLNI